MSNPAPIPHTVLDRIADFLVAVQADEGRRQKLLENPRAFLQDQGVFVPDDMDLQVHENTVETYYFVLPPDPNDLLEDEALTAVAGGKTASTSGTAGSLASASTLVITWSTFSSAGTVGTLGSAS